MTSLSNYYSNELHSGLPHLLTVHCWSTICPSVRPSARPPVCPSRTSMNRNQSSGSVCFHYSRFELHVRVAPCNHFFPALSQRWIHKCHLRDEMQNCGLFLCAITRHGQRSVIMSGRLSLEGGVQTDVHVPPSVTLTASLPRSASASSLAGSLCGGTRRWWVPQMELKCLVLQLSPMQIALSTDCIIESSQPSVLFDAFLLFIFCHDVLICGTAASPVNVSDSNPLISLALCRYFAPGLPPLLHGLLQHLQYSHTVSVCVSLSSCCETTCVVATPVIRGKVSVSPPRFANLYDRGRCERDEQSFACCDMRPQEGMTTKKLWQIQNYSHYFR